MLCDTELRQLATAILCASGDASDMASDTSYVRVVQLDSALSLLSTYSDQCTVVTVDGATVKLTHANAQERR